MPLQFLDLAVNSSAILHQRENTLNYDRSLVGWQWDIQFVIRSFIQSIRWIDMKVLEPVFGFLYYASQTILS